MSHFVFGIAQGLLGPDLKAAAKARRLCCRIGKEIPQPVVQQMLAKELTNQDGTPFMLTEGENDDTSDALVSPYAAGIEGAVAGVARCIAWARDLARGAGHVVLLLTEGYDEQFVEQDAEEALSLIKSEAWLPSIKIRFEGVSSRTPP